MVTLFNVNVMRSRTDYVLKKKAMEIDLKNGLHNAKSSLKGKVGTLRKLYGLMERCHCGVIAVSNRIRII